ncbi:hypothetical protein ABZP36_034309 [Zizania latifolia]
MRYTHRSVCVLLHLALLVASCFHGARSHEAAEAAATAITEVKTDAAAPTVASEEAVVIGSRPPDCNGRCVLRCLYCEATLVAIEPPRLVTTAMATAPRRGRAAVAMPQAQLQVAAAYGDDHSMISNNYKPLRWECSCRGSHHIINKS